MTTQLDRDLVPDIFDLLEEVGIEATFREYVSLSPNPDQSEVLLGNPTNYVVTVSPPQRKMIEVTIDEEIIETEAMVVFLATGSGTADDIGFVPRLSTEETSMTCIVLGVNYSLIKIEPYVSGDHVAAYRISLRKR